MAERPASTEMPKWAGFMDLSPELRNRIYEYALVSSEDLLVGFRKTYSWFWSGYGLCPNLLATCRQINQEATPVLYGANTFCVRFHHMLGFMEAFLDAIGDSQSIIRNVTLNMESFIDLSTGSSRARVRRVTTKTLRREAEWALLARASGLKKLHVKVFGSELTKRYIRRLGACVGRLSATSLDLCEGVSLVMKVEGSGRLTDKSWSEDFKDELRKRYA